jgi:hypothetical protein
MPHVWLAMIWTALALLAASVASAAQAADKVAVGTGGSASDAPFYIAYDKGFFKDEGLDVGSGALSVGFWNALLRGVKFRIVADRGHAEPGYLYQTVFMRKDLVDGGQFKSLADLKGLRMGFAAQGVTSLSLLNEAAKFGGIKYEDVVPVLSLLSAADRGAAEQGARRHLPDRAAGDRGGQCRLRRALHGYQRVLSAPADLHDLLQRQVRAGAQGRRGQVHARLAARRARLQRRDQGRQDRRIRRRRGRADHGQELQHEARAHS